jgi:hypothetical protein
MWSLLFAADEPLGAVTVCATRTEQRQWSFRTAVEPAFPDTHGFPSRPGLSGTRYGPIVEALSSRGAASWAAEAGPGAAGKSVVSQTSP